MAQKTKKGKPVKNRNLAGGLPILCGVLALLASLNPDGEAVWRVLAFIFGAAAVVVGLVIFNPKLVRK